MEVARKEIEVVKQEIESLKTELRRKIKNLKLIIYFLIVILIANFGVFV